MTPTNLVEAIQEVSKVFALRLKFLTGKHGWVTQSELRTVARAREERTVSLTVATVRLPGGVIANFIPRDDPEADGKAWVIDVQRTDGVKRRVWVDGLRVVQVSGRFVIQHHGAVLTDDAIRQLFESLVLPAPVGPVRAIHRAWNERFGEVPVFMADRLEDARDTEKLDEFHAAILSAADAEE